MDVGLAMRAEDVARIPKPDGTSGLRSPGTSGALVRRVAGDALDDEMIDRGVGIETQHLVQTGVDHVGDAFDRQRGFGDVRRQDDFAPRCRRERALLRIDVERAVQRQHERVGIRKIRGRSLDLAHAGQEAEDVAARIA